jgi:predicted peptidase
VKPYRVESQVPAASADGPVLFFLHGAGEIGTDLRHLRRHGPWLRGPDGRPKNPLAAPSISKLRVLAPLLEERTFWEPERLAFTLQQNLGKIAPAETPPVCLVGLSLGGRGVLDFALGYPRRFAAILCFCPAGGRSLVPSITALSETPIWFVHRINDDIVPAVHSAVLYDALKPHGHAWRTVLPPEDEAAHDCWTAIFAHPATYDWLRNPSAPPPEAAVMQSGDGG